MISEEDISNGREPVSRNYLKERCPGTCDMFGDQLGCSTINRRHIDIPAGIRQPRSDIMLSSYASSYAPGRLSDASFLDED